MNKMEKIDQLINMPYYMIDLLPRRVQKKNREQFLAVEEYFRKEKQLKKILRESYFHSAEIEQLLQY